MKDMKTISIMQPYIFPYLPYYQLAHAVDEFWLFDDVQYIRRGWMNRNDLLNQGMRQRFTLPVRKGSQKDLIKDKLLAENFADELNGLIKNINNTYAKAPYANISIEILERLAGQPWLTFLDFAESSLQETFRTLGIRATLQRTSKIGIEKELSAPSRIIEICHQVGAKHYINPIGGIDLYNRQDFKEEGLKISFLKGRLGPYPQGQNRIFEAGLSILDFLAWVHPDQYPLHLDDYDLI